MEYRPTIGLEVHAELKTRTKMFCDSLNDPDEKHPNVNVCPVCLGHPGTLPVINKAAVEAVVKVGLAMDSSIATHSRFDRKNYFYPDLPKGYQISQSGEPLVGPGTYAGVRINHIHLEEDAGKLVHDDVTGSTLVDYNRASVPLMELVTEPDIHSAEAAVAFMKEIQLLLRYLGVADADLERGQMRADANISISAEPDVLGPRTEVKNLNSFSAVFSAIKHEIKRQTELLEKGERVKQETRGWDEAKQKTVPQRSKEHAHDYRYFPEPDLPPFEPTKVFDIEDLKRHLPELPRVKQARFVKEFGLSERQAGQLVEDKRLAEFFEEAESELAELENPESSNVEKSAQELLFNYLTTDLAGLMNESGASFEECKVSPAGLAALIDLITGGKIGSRQAKDILRKMFETGESAEDILNAEGLHTVSGEDELGKIVDEVIAENSAAVADYKKGKTASLQFMIGKAMGKLKGRGNPGVLRTLFEQKLL
ncbi:MAG TPA: Asp-tRNA(Asn)/Glu-tRNA(Gln) amidotransferase subunit GatB [Candidatus Paceibacterota bacterium]|nr:Asp-tRNA(Asn)/Glu-tRNA(Gln) amidotransferase subunit GatB [Candidatus Paceibacterota bacterium]